MSEKIQQILLGLQYGRYLQKIYKITFANYRPKRKLILHFSRKKIEILCNYLLHFLGSETSVPSKSLYIFGGDVLHGIILIHRKQANDLLECLMKLLECPFNAVLVYSDPGSEISNFERTSEISDWMSVMGGLYMNNADLTQNFNVVRDLREITLSDDEDLISRCPIESDQVFMANPEFLENFNNGDEDQFNMFMKEFEQLKNESVVELPPPEVTLEPESLILPPKVSLDREAPERPIPPTEENIPEQHPSTSRFFRCHYEDVLPHTSLANLQFKQPLPASMFHYDDLSGDERGSVKTPQPRGGKRGRRQVRKNRQKQNKVTIYPPHLLKRHNYDSSWKTKEPKLWTQPDEPLFDLDEPITLLEKLYEFEDLLKEVNDIYEEDLEDRPPLSLGSKAVLLRAEALQNYLQPKGIGEIQEPTDLPMIPLHEPLICPVSLIEPQEESRVPEIRDPTTHVSTIPAPLDFEISAARPEKSHKSLLFEPEGVELSPHKKRRLTSLLNNVKTQQLQADELQVLEEQQIIPEPPLIGETLQVIDPFQLQLPEEHQLVGPPLIGDQVQVIPPLPEDQHDTPRPRVRPRLRPRREPMNYDDEGPPPRRKPRRKQIIPPIEPEIEQLAVPLPLDQQFEDQFIPNQEHRPAFEIDIRSWTKEDLLNKLKGMRGIIKFTDICPRGTRKLTTATIFSLLIKMYGEGLIDITQEDSTGNPDKIFFWVI